MPVSAGIGNGVQGCTLKAWGIVNTAGNALVKGANVASVVANTINLSTPLASTNAVVRMHYMGNLDVVVSGYANTTSAIILGMFSISTGGTPQAGLCYFEVWE